MADEPIEEIVAHKSHVNAVEFSPDGEFLVSAGMDGLVKLWRAGEWELFSTFFGHRKSADFLSFDPDGSILVTSSTDRTVRVWSFPFGREERVEEGLSSALISPSGGTVASLESADRVRLWSLEDGSSVGRLDHESRVSAMAFEPDGEHLVVASAGSEMVRWKIDGAPGEAVRIPSEGVAVSELRFFDGGRRLVASGHDGVVRVYDTAGWAEVLRVDLDVEGAFPLAVSPEEDELAVGSVRRVRTFATDDGSLRRDVELPGAEVRSLAYSPGGEWLTVAGADKRIRIWERS